MNKNPSNFSVFFNFRIKKADIKSLQFILSLITSSSLKVFENI